MVEFNESEIDEIIKEELTKDIVLEADASKPKPAKVFPKVAGIVNLGRTFFAGLAEIKDKDDYAQTQMAQKYGGEIYGLSGSFKGGSQGSNSNLISCSVQPYLKIPGEGFKESGGYGGGFDGVVDLIDSVIEFWQGEGQVFQKYSDRMKNGLDKQKWIKNHKHLVQKLSNIRRNFNQEGGANSKENKAIQQQILEILYKDPQTQKEYYGSDNKKGEGYIKEYEELVGGQNGFTTKWNNWKNGKASLNGRNDPVAAAQGGNQDNSWNPNLTFIINIKTDFNEEWFKKKFKSGFLNKAIDAIKTSAASRLPDGAGEMKGHKFDSNTMEPGDKRKLDSLQWKMTNKVAKDYITYLLGWSRKKEKYPDNTVASELKEDSGFGKKMADKALNNRGILGRLKQKVFAGQQSNNAISVVFQLADPNDGSWKTVKKPVEEDPSSAGDANGDKDKDKGGNEKGEQKSEPKNSGTPKTYANPSTSVSSVKPANSAPKKPAPSVSKTDTTQNKTPKMGIQSNGKSMTQVKPAMKSGTPQIKQSGKKVGISGNKNKVQMKNTNVKDASPNVELNNKGVDKKDVKLAAESIGGNNDALLDLFIECYNEVEREERLDLVRNVCESGKGVDELVDNCLNGEIWK